MKLIYFEIKNMKNWVFLFVLSALCAFIGMIVSSYVLSFLSDEWVFALAKNIVASAVFMFLFINGHLLGEKFIVIQETKNDQGSVVRYKSGTIVVFWIIITTAITKLCGLLFLECGFVDERNILLPWNVVAACVVAILTLILFGAFSRNEFGGRDTD